jgi:hypothetical protein
MVRRPLLFCGLLSPLLYAVADALAGLRWERYSFRDQTISELGATGAPPLAVVPLRQREPALRTRVESERAASQP